MYAEPRLDITIQWDGARFKVEMKSRLDLEMKDEDKETISPIAPSAREDSIIGLHSRCLYHGTIYNQDSLPDLESMSSAAAIKTRTQL